jgi:hypothetical protein
MKVPLPKCGLAGQVFKNAVLLNAARSAAYLALTFVFVNLIYGRFPKEWGATLSSLVGASVETPLTFITVLFVSLLFVLFILLTSAAGVVRGQDHFKTSFMMRLFLFAMNILPIALFLNVFFHGLGFRAVFFFVVYLVMQFFLDFLFIHIYRTMGRQSHIFLVIAKVLNEILAIALSLVVIVFLAKLKILWPYREFLDDLLDPRNTVEFVIYFAYLVMYNSVAFFTVEFCMDTFREEYKKNYVKYIFLYNSNIFKRVIFLLRIVLPQTLGKIRANLTWLVMFILTVESIFKITNSIGFRLVDYAESSRKCVVMVRNISYVLIIMFIINVLIDLVIQFFNIRKEATEEKNGGGTVDRLAEKTTAYVLSGDTYSPRKKPFFKPALLVLGCLYIALFVFNQKEYAFAGYYDFSGKNVPMVGELLQYIKTYSDGVPDSLEEKFALIPFYEKTANSNYYKIVRFDVLDSLGEMRHLYPYYDVVEGYCYIDGTHNFMRLRGISSEDRIVDVQIVEKYKYVPRIGSGILTDLRLPADSNRALFTKRPLYLIIPYYLFFFLTLLFITIGLTWAVYRGITGCLFRTEGEPGRLIKILGRCTSEVLLYLNTLTLIVIFLLFNQLLESDLASAWENRAFYSTFISYAIVQIAIILLLSGIYVNEVILHARKLLSSREFDYYSLIGMEWPYRYSIYQKKYGSVLFTKLVFQNILFVFNINWFISYAFNMWFDFTDNIGVTYSISLENILTKLTNFYGVTMEDYNFIIIAVINLGLFAGYYYYHRKLIGDAVPLWKYRWGISFKRNQRGL